MRNLSIIILVMGVMLAVPPALAQKIEPVVKTLDNGTTVALIENHQSPVVALRVYVRTGSLHEQEFLGAGVSHFLEHLVAGGTTSKRTEDEASKLLDSIGAEFNAYTTKDHTCYYMSTASQYLDDALDLISDWTTNASVTQEEWEREYEVIQREMETRRSNPNVILAEAMDRMVFTAFPARMPVIGYRDSFRALTRDDVYAYYRRAYRPDNLLFVAAGDFDTAEMLKKAEAAFGLAERRAAPPIALPEEPRQVAPRKTVVEMPAGQAYLNMTWRTIPLTHEDLYPLDCLSFILSAGESSRLVRRLRDEMKLVNSISSWSFTPGYDGGEFAISATLDPDKLEAAQAAIMQEIKLVREELVTDDELQRAKRQKVSEFVFGLQTAEALASSVGMDILAAHDPEFSEQYVERIQATTPEAIRQAAQRYLTEERICVGILRPPREAKTAEEQAAAVPVGEIHKVMLDNGMTLLIKRNPTAPIVSIQAFMLGGLRFEPEGKNGMSAFTARMLTRGTETRAAEDIALAFDRMGGSIGGGSGSNSFYLTSACLAENFPDALEIFADALRNPAFPDDEVERTRQLFMAAAERRLDDWHNELSEEFRSEFFPTNPYGKPGGGTLESLAGITRQDLVNFHGSYAIPSNAVMAIFGDVDDEQAVNLVTRYFGDWTGPANPTFPEPTPDAAPAEDRTVHRTGKSEMGGVFVGYPGMTVKDVQDRYAMDVLDSLISGISLPRGWLHQELRGKGLVYEVHGFNFVGLDPGFFGIYAGTEPGRVEEVQKIILAQVARLFTDEISADALESAKRVCITAHVLDTQTNAQQAMDAGLNELYGLGYEFSEDYAQGIVAVTVDDVRDVAKKYLTHSVTVLMTPAKQEP